MNIETIDVDPDFKSVGQAAVAVVDKAGKAMAERQASTPPSDPMQMAFALIQSGADSASVKELLAISREIASERAKSEFNEAMSAAKAEIPTIRKNRTVDFTSSKGRTNYQHEDLAEVARTVNPILSKYGLSYRFRTTSEIGQPISVTCIISHRLGHSEENTLIGPRDESGNKNSLQQVGSTLTYLQRMTLKASLGLAAADDDDGKAGGSSEDGGPVSEDQRAALDRLLEECGADKALFCEKWKVESLADFPANKLDEATASVRRWFENQQKRSGTR